jgi:hypothetical protein
MKPNTNIYGLIIKCPFNEEDPICPFRNIREMNIKERINYIKINIHESCDLYEKHINCSFQRCQLIKNKK